MAKRTCSIDGCSSPSRTRGMCEKHYQRLRAHGDPHVSLNLRGAPPIVRFERWVDRASSPNGCWLWLRGKSHNGYGRFKVGGRTVQAHRWSYEYYVGPIPAGLRACHHCDTPACVNPAHIFLGSDADNVYDCVSKGRARGGNSDKLSPEVQMEIQRRYTGKRGEQTTLAREYGVHSSTIARVARRGQRVAA